MVFWKRAELKSGHSGQSQICCWAIIPWPPESGLMHWVMRWGHSDRDDMCAWPWWIQSYILKERYMSECHLWVWGEKGAIWVVSRKGQENFYRDHRTKGLQSPPLLCLPFWLCSVPAVGLLESQLTSLDITSSPERRDRSSSYSLRPKDFIRSISTEPGTQSDSVYRYSKRTTEIKNLPLL